MLGASTQHYKTYGKRKTNVINRRVALFNSNSPLASNRGGGADEQVQAKAKSGGWSDSSDSDDAVVPVTPVVVKAPQVKKQVVVPRARSVFVGIEIVQDKENRRRSSKPGTSTPATVKKDVKPETSTTPAPDQEGTESEAARAPFKSKAAKSARRSESRRARARRIVESSDDEAEPSRGHEEVELIDDKHIVDLADDETDDDDDDSRSESSHHDDVDQGNRRTPRAFPRMFPLPFPSALKPLLALTFAADCPKPFDFASFVESPPPPFANSRDKAATWRKVGEASYSEVFSTGSQDGCDIVVKIIPISPLEPSKIADTDEGEDMPFTSDWHAVKREIEVSRLVGGSDGLEGFVRYRGAFLVQGRYPRSLLDSWDAFKRSQKPPCDDQIRPSCLPASQMYALVLLDHAGQDLETWKVRDWIEAREIWDQVVERLGTAEADFEFEHRDLHWGNILVAPAQPDVLADRLDSLHLTPQKAVAQHRGNAPTPTVTATLIDFTLSRMRQPPPSGWNRSKGRGAVLFDAFEDECIFEGEGDRQFDVYRAMKTVVERRGTGWEGFHPETNLLWLHYLVGKLLRGKKLRIPASPPSRTSNASSSPFSSPARAVPSPRKTRRQSLLVLGATTSTLAASATTERKARTLPSNHLLSAATKHRAAMLSEKQRREMEREVEAWESLQRAEQELERLLGDLVTDEDAARRKPGRKAGSTKRQGQGRKKVVRGKSDDATESSRGGAAEFAEWWRRERDEEEGAVLSPV
ncbi:hypothetical protein JCM10212_004635 [Sporobolomyces blumeae]